MVKGGSIDFRTRTMTGGIGSSYDLLIIDEAQEYQKVHVSALQYTIAASKNPQTIMGGTPSTPISSGTVFKEYRDDVLSGKVNRAGWIEWSTESMTDPNNKEIWYILT